jgi:hypothetical protein
VIDRGRYGHSAAIYALLAAERRGHGHPPAGTRGSGSTRSPALAGALGDAHDPRAYDGDAGGSPLACHAITPDNVEALAHPEHASATPERVRVRDASEPRQPTAELSVHFAPPPP